jgi:hypothetical protein
VIPFPLAALVILLAVTAVPAAAQTAPVRAFDELHRSVGQAQADAVLQLRLRWYTAEPTANPARTANRFELLAAESVPGSLRRDRAPQVSSTSLVAVSLDGGGRELDWRTLTDPRVVRAEASGGGQLTGERLYYLEIDVLLQVPDLRQTSRVRLYSVRAENGRAVLDPLGTVDVR